jgi:hypothetical protein
MDHKAIAHLEMLKIEQKLIGTADLTNHGFALYKKSGCMTIFAIIWWKACADGLNNELRPFH